MTTTAPYSMAELRSLCKKVWLKHRNFDYACEELSTAIRSDAEAQQALAVIGIRTLIQEAQHRFNQSVTAPAAARWTPEAARAASKVECECFLDAVYDGDKAVRDMSIDDMMDFYRRESNRAVGTLGIALRFKYIAEWCQQHGTTAKSMSVKQCKQIEERAERDAREAAR